MNNAPYEILAFYKFVRVDNLEERRLALLEAMRVHAIKGTLILAPEGINGSLAGLPANVEAFLAQLCAEPAFADLSFKRHWHEINPFDKAKVKLRKEIVTLGVPGIDPTVQVGNYVSPAEWNVLLADPDTIVVDTRNVYEISMGTFKHALDPNTQNFRDFPAFVEESLTPHRDKKIAMYCTGGIRCEKSTAYLLQQGFKEVYHLEGGILKYLETIKPEDSLWEGNCFVFDERIAVDHALETVPGAVSTKWG